MQNADYKLLKIKKTNTSPLKYLPEMYQSVFVVIQLSPIHLPKERQEYRRDQFARTSA
jgi:hypothetical protein